MTNQPKNDHIKTSADMKVFTRPPKWPLLLFIIAFNANFWIVYFN